MSEELLAKQVIEVNQKLLLNYLARKKKSFIDVDELESERDQLKLEKLSLLSQSTITGHQATVRMLQMKYNSIQEPMDESRKLHYELLRNLRQLRVQYFYDNDLVAN